MKTAVEWFVKQLSSYTTTDANIISHHQNITHLFEQAKEMEKEQMLDFGEFIIDELEPMAQNREWVEERYNYFKSE